MAALRERVTEVEAPISGSGRCALRRPARRCGRALRPSLAVRWYAPLSGVGRPFAEAWPLLVSLSALELTALVDTLTLGRPVPRRGAHAPRTRPPYPPEFRVETVRLLRSVGATIRQA